MICLINALQDSLFLVLQEVGKCPILVGMLDSFPFIPMDNVSPSTPDLTEQEELNIDLILAQIDLSNSQKELMAELPAFLGVDSLEEVEGILSELIEVG